MQGGQAIGTTDEVGYTAIERPVHPNSLHATILHAGRPVVFTTMMLAMGFALLIPSEFNGLKDFGWLSAICIGLALFADLLTLPAVLALNERWRRSRRPS